MTGAVEGILAHADYFLLMLIRVGGLIISSPIYGRVNIPNIVKICFVFAVNYLLFLSFPQTVDITYSSLLEFILLCASEFLIGVSMAFIMNIFFSLVSYTAGQLIDMQIGFGIVSVYDAQNNTQAPVMGNILNLMLLLVFFSTDCHLTLIEMIYLTIQRMPIGTLVFSPGIGLLALELFGKAFALGVMMALPLIASGLTIEIAFGVLMRAVPQIHMFVVGVPLKMIVGLLLFVVTMPVYGNFSTRILNDMFSGMTRMFATFTG